MLIIKINKLKKYHLQIFGAIAWRNGIVVLRRQISIRHVVSSLKTSLNTNYFQTHKIFYIFFLLWNTSIYNSMFRTLLIFPVQNYNADTLINKLKPF